MKKLSLIILLLSIGMMAQAQNSYDSLYYVNSGKKYYYSTDSIPDSIYGSIGIMPKGFEPNKKLFIIPDSLMKIITKSKEKDNIHLLASDTSSMIVGWVSDSEDNKQISIASSEGDRMNYFLNGNVWETELTIKSKFSLMVYVSDGYEVVSIQNLSLSQSELKKLKEYINKLTGLATGSGTWELSTGSLGAFRIYYKDENGNVPINQKAGKINLDYLRNKIRAFFNNQ